MKNFNWEYDIPKLRNILTVIVIVLGVAMIAFHWTAAEFAFRILFGLTIGLSAVQAWLEKHRVSAVLDVCLTVIWFVLAGFSYFKYNV